MLNFIKNYWSEILSVVGAAAWLPVIFKVIVNYFRQIQVTVLDSRVLTNATAVSVGKKEKISGTMLLLAMNLFIKDITLFARKISVIVKLKDGTVANSEILDFSTLKSNNDDDTTSIFDVPVKEEFNISRTINSNADNIKYMAFMVKSINFSSVDDISEIEIRIFYNCWKIKLFSKKVVIHSSDFPTFNSSHIFDVVERIQAK